MAISMATPWAHPKTGVYYVRVRVPLDLVAVVGKAVEKKSLRTKDASEAKRRFVVEHGKLVARWQNMRGGLINLRPIEAAAIAGEFYRETVREGSRWSPFQSGFRAHFATQRIENPWDAKSIEDFQAIFGETIDEWLQDRGLQLDPRCVPTFEIAVARAFRDGELKRSAIVLEGDYSPDPAAARYPPLAQAFPDGLEAKTEKLTFGVQFDAYAADVRLAVSTIKRWRNAILTLAKSVGHDDLRRISTADIEAWLEGLRVAGRAPRTIRDVHLASIKALLGWHVEKKKLATNPAVGIRVRVPKDTIIRDRDLTDREALTILRASLERQPPQLGKRHADARRWIPWLCAYTGARVNELTQLRVEDVMEDDGVPYIRITPEAGTVKTGGFRDVPLHPHLVEQGFLAFARKRKAGPIFYESGDSKSVATPPYKKLGERLAAWVRAVGVDDPNVDPNHGWRHRMKTVGSAVEIPERVLDAIQGHAPTTQGRRYGHVQLAVKAREIAKLPRYEV